MDSGLATTGLGELSSGLGGALLRSPLPGPDEARRTRSHLHGKARHWVRPALVSSEGQTQSTLPFRGGPYEGPTGGGAVEEELSNALPLAVPGQH